MLAHASWLKPQNFFFLRMFYQFLSTKNIVLNERIRPWMVAQDQPSETDVFLFTIFRSLLRHVRTATTQSITALIMKYQLKELFRYCSFNTNNGEINDTVSKEGSYFGLLIKFQARLVFHY